MTDTDAFAYYLSFNFNRQRKKFDMASFQNIKSIGKLRKKDVKRFLIRMEKLINKKYDCWHIRYCLLLYSLIIIGGILSIILVLVLKGSEDLLPLLLSTCLIMGLSSICFICYVIRKSAIPQDIGRASIIKKNAEKLIKKKEKIFLKKGFKWIISPKFPDHIELWKASHLESPVKVDSKGKLQQKQGLNDDNHLELQETRDDERINRPYIAIEMGLKNILNSNKSPPAYLAEKKFSI